MALHRTCIKSQAASHAGKMPASFVSPKCQYLFSTFIIVLLLWWCMRCHLYGTMSLNDWMYEDAMIWICSPHYWLLYEGNVLVPGGHVDSPNKEPGPRFNIKMSSYQYRKSHCGDKTVVRSSYLHNGISYTGKMSSLYWIGAQLCWALTCCGQMTPCGNIDQS